MQLSVADHGTALAPTLELARAYVHAAKAKNTVRAYRADWQHFESWCETNGQSSLPATAATVALYLAAMGSTLKPATLARRLTAITYTHRTHGFTTPASLSLAPVSQVLQGIRRVHTTAPACKTPLLTADLQRIIAAIPPALPGIRDTAILLLGFSGGFRRGELAQLDVNDVRFCAEGMAITLRRSKTDQEGQGRLVGIPQGNAFCPVAAVRQWLTAACLADGALFRGIDRFGRLSSGRLHATSIADIIKRSVERVGLDPACYAGHSLRAGLVTQAYLRGAREHAIMQQTGHRSTAVLRRYIRKAGVFTDNAASTLGL